MKKGVILEVNHEFVTLLTPEGEFMRARKREQDYHIGEEISFFPMEVDRPRVRHRFLLHTKVRPAAVAAAVLLFSAIAIFPVIRGNQVYAYMSIDVNPSIELGLNQHLKVVTVDAYNEEGKRIVSRLKDWKKEDAVIVAERILDEVELQGYLQEEKNVLIGTANSEEQIESAEVQLKETINEIKEAGKTENLKVMVISGTAAERAAAQKQGLTMGAYKKQSLPQPVAEPPAEKRALPPAAEPVPKQPSQPSVVPGQKQENPGTVGQNGKTASGKDQPQSNMNGNTDNRIKTDKNESKQAEKDQRGWQDPQPPVHAEKKGDKQEKEANNTSGSNRNEHSKPNRNENGSDKQNGSQGGDKKDANKVGPSSTNGKN